MDIDVEGSLMDFKSAMDEAYNLSQLDLANNTTMKQFELQEQMLDKALKITKLANVPTVSVNAAYLYTALGNDGKFGDRKAWNPYSYAGVQLNIPIFAGNAKRAATRQARLNLSNLQLQRENTERQLKVAMIQSLNSMQTSVKQFNSADATVAQAKRGYEISVKRYEVGRGTLVEIDNSQLALTQAELSRNSSIYNFLTSKVALDKILGNLEF
jgi:outer membrane protein TolC